MCPETLTGLMFAQMVAAGAANLNRSRRIVNDLNVFPVPDGDTGDNMYMTIDSGASAAVSLHDAPLFEVAAAAARAMLLGARGNSGVILSQIFAGISDGLAGLGTASLEKLAMAMESGVEKAYGAVSKPVEGTILTVYKDAVRYANSRVPETSTFLEYFENIFAEMKRSLERTPELLAELREAGVVDSGGAGIVYITEGMKKVLAGEETASEKTEAAPAAKPALDLDLFTEDSELGYGYCTEFLLRLQTKKLAALGTAPAEFDIAPMKDYLESVGDSLVIFKNGTIVKVHVHVRTPGEVLSEMQKYGEFLTLKIENMTLQHEETLTEKAPEADLTLRRKVRKRYGTVCVAAGEGLRQAFLDLGVDFVVDGGQSMNPSAADFVAAFRQVDADTIFVFPGNGNIVMAAKQAAALYEDARVEVLPAKTLGQSWAALSVLDLSLPDADAVRDSALAAMEGAVTGMVAPATRDTEADGVTVRKGDYLGFTDDAILVDGANRADTLLALADRLSAGDYDVMMLISGADADPDEAEGLAESLQKKFRRTEVIPLEGGQPVYAYILILE